MMHLWHINTFYVNIDHNFAPALGQYVVGECDVTGK